MGHETRDNAKMEAISFKILLGQLTSSFLLLLCQDLNKFNISYISCNNVFISQQSCYNFPISQLSCNNFNNLNIYNLSCSNLSISQLSCNNLSISRINYNNFCISRLSWTNLNNLNARITTNPFDLIMIFIGPHPPPFNVRGCWNFGQSKKHISISSIHESCSCRSCPLHFD